jgi:hypothetical protein
LVPLRDILNKHVNGFDLLNRKVGKVIPNGFGYDEVNGILKVS